MTADSTSCVRSPVETAESSSCDARETVPCEGRAHASQNAHACVSPSFSACSWTTCCHRVRDLAPSSADADEGASASGRGDVRATGDAPRGGGFAFWRQPGAAEPGEDAGGAREGGGVVGSDACTGEWWHTVARVEGARSEVRGGAHDGDPTAVESRASAHGTAIIAAPPVAPRS